MSRVCAQQYDPKSEAKTSRLPIGGCLLVKETLDLICSTVFHEWSTHFNISIAVDHGLVGIQILHRNLNLIKCAALLKAYMQRKLFATVLLNLTTTTQHPKYQGIICIHLTS